MQRKSSSKEKLISDWNNMKQGEIHLSFWWVVLYYLIAGILCPHITCNPSPIPYMGEVITQVVIPTTAGIVGILTSGYHDGRKLSWFVFLLGIAPVVHFIYDGLSPIS
ncbi:MAG: hypothetical protein PF692_12325 [Kiritimatiellae bacterium]|jgi:uncharacterized membrane protein YhaH (DUF805 family)|nr:hypothetical protein [Kiritimatiellia bacterium]